MMADEDEINNLYKLGYDKSALIDNAIFKVWL